MIVILDKEANIDAGTFFCLHCIILAICQLGNLAVASPR